MRYSPGFAVFIVLTAAIAIGANTTIFGAVNAIMLRPLPYAESDQLVKLSGAYKGRGSDWSVSLPNAVDWGTQNRSFSDVAYFQSGGYGLAAEGEPERVEALRTSAS